MGMDSNSWNETVIGRIIEFYGFMNEGSLLDWLAKAAKKYERYGEKLLALAGYYKAHGESFAALFERNKVRLQAG